MYPSHRPLKGCKWKACKRYCKQKSRHYKTKTGEKRIKTQKLILLCDALDLSSLIQDSIFRHVDHQSVHAIYSLWLKGKWRSWKPKFRIRPLFTVNVAGTAKQEQDGTRKEVIEEFGVLKCIEVSSRINFSIFSFLLHASQTQTPGGSGAVPLVPRTSLIKHLQTQTDDLSCPASCPRF